MVGLLGCAPAKLLLNETYPGGVTSREGEFDGLDQVQMKPAFVFLNSASLDTSIVKLGVRWTSAAGGGYRLITQIDKPQWFRSSKDLLLKIDGIEHRLKPAHSNRPGESLLDSILINNGVAETLATTAVVRKEYVVSEQVLRSMLQADQVLGRVHALRGMVDFTLKSNAVDVRDVLFISQLFSYQLKNFFKRLDGVSLQASTYQ
jgi:hypothetical protein